MSGTLYVATLVTALGCGLVAGAFFAFSSFVMAALGRLPAAGGIAAMQSINVVAVNPVFMAAIFGTGAACLGLAAWTAVASDGWTMALVLAGCALYLIGAIGVTIAANVPLNDRLAKLRPRDGEAAGYWNEYVARWTAWNHLRTVAALVAAILTVALQA
jgi:uncharacterized membrane protein